MNSVKRILPLVVLLIVLVGTRTVRATYSYYYTENLGSPNWSNWVSAGRFVETYGSYSGAGAGQTMMYATAEPGGADVSMTVRFATKEAGYPYYQPEAVYYAIVSSDSTRPNLFSPSGNFTVASVDTYGNVEVRQIANGGPLTILATARATVQDGSTVRTVAGNGYIGVYIDGTLVVQTPWTGLSGPSYNGISCYDPYSSTDGDMITSVSLGQIDTLGPTAIPSSSIGISTGYSYVDLTWPTADDGGGPGIYEYSIYRNGLLLATTQLLSYSDTNLTPNTNYPYTITATDIHFKSASTNFNASTPNVPTNPPYPSTTPDGRRTGVRSTGAYWGASPETIDVESGNLNFGVPLLNAQQRGGKSVTFSLIYNSQNWRKDSGGTWLFDSDVGYGFGFRLMAGSIQPIWNPGGMSASDYIFTDATGAQYNLNQVSGNVWSSKESIYIWFDASTNILHFRDGSFWVFDCISSASENDSGTMYPTTMEDSNGNQILVRYETGSGATWSNSSARISQIEDVRAVDLGGSHYTYGFNYNMQGHLTSISNTISTGETYSLSYNTSAALSDPFGGNSYGTVTELSQVTVTNIGTYHGFTYDGSGELTKIQLPYKGYLAYDYGTTTYSGPGGTKSYREVTNRYLSKDGSTQTTYPFTKDSNPNADVHSHVQRKRPSNPS